MGLQELRKIKGIGTMYPSAYSISSDSGKHGIQDTRHDKQINNTMRHTVDGLYDTTHRRYTMDNLTLEDLPTHLKWENDEGEVVTIYIGAMEPALAEQILIKAITVKAKAFARKWGVRLMSIGDVYLGNRDTMIKRLAVEEVIGHMLMEGVAVSDMPEMYHGIASAMQRGI